MRTFPPVDPSETIALSFDFGPDLLVGETLVGPPTFVVNTIPQVLPMTVKGTPVPGVVTGTATISGTIATQLCNMAPLVLGQFYGVEGTCSTSTGRVLTEGALLPCKYSVYIQ